MSDIDLQKLPRHIAVIMDGNGRWAASRSLSRTEGHREGARRVKEIVKAAGELGVKVITFFAFSSENWSRPQKEIAMLMRYLKDFLGREIKEMEKNNIRFLGIGRDAPLPPRIVEPAQLDDRTRRADFRDPCRAG